MMAGVNRFYDDYYFRPKVVWRIVKEALWDGHERKRLYHEATEFLKLRSERLKWAREGGDGEKPLISVPSGTFRFRQRLTRRNVFERKLRVKTLAMVFAMVVCATTGDSLLKHGMSTVRPRQLSLAMDSCTVFWPP